MTNKSLISQFLEQYFIAVKYFISPRYYYAYRFFEKENRREIDHYLLTNPTYLFAYLNRFQNSELINNKLSFTVFCQQQGLSVAPVLASFSQGIIVPTITDTVVDPKKDIVVKPISASKGDGFMLWKYKRKGFYQAVGQSPISWQRLVKELETLSNKRALLLQARLFNHVLIADLSKKALITARIVTYQTLSGETDYLAAVLQIPIGDRITNNIGLVSPIDKATGKLGKAWRLKPIAIHYKHHPDTGGLIIGRQLPFWNEALELVLTAHSKLNQFTSLGWDVAFTEKGPLLIETNINWDIDIIQRPHKMPLGKTKFAEAVLARLVDSKGT